MLFNYRVIKLVQKLAKLFSTHAQRCYKVIDVGSPISTDQNIPSVLLKRNRLMTALGLRSYIIDGRSVFKSNGKKECLFSKQTPLVSRLASRNYKINGLGSFKNNDEKESLLNQKQLVTELASRNYKIAVLSEFKNRDRKESLFSMLNPVATELASRNYMIIIVSTLRSNKHNECILKKSNQLVVELPSRSIKVSVLGAAGRVGQPLSMLLKLNPLVSQLALYDIAKVTPGVAVDISHINTCTRVKAFVGPGQLCGCLRESKVVIMLAGKGMTEKISSRDELFKANAPVTYDLVDAVAKHCPSACVAIITNPVNSLVPLANEVMKKHNICASNRIFGICTLDPMRASTFVAQFTCEDPNKQYVPVIGGHGSGTVIPLLSQSVPPVYLDDYTRIGLTRRIQEAGSEVIDAKLKTQASTLSMAFAAARFTNSLLKALMGEQNVVECAYVKTDLKECPYFAAPIVLGPEGMKLFLGMGKLDEFENSIVKHAIPILKENIKLGEDFALKHKTICLDK